uniref:NADH-ubiquinone oxidoreductase chain 6 n=1 Tax=Macroxyela ferruginea TaxID=48208 RepID=A0A6G5ZVF4_9HYME|nr:NADH dehydrogenase subunit 6 [Macroxyela ferruginea]QHR79730.1 NADH dehydrogenase subunit 6 [Macroxyela ferruginea]
MLHFLYLLCLILGLFFIKMTHPLAMGLMLLIQTFLVSVITGLSTQSFWFSYILFLVMLGGMLVLFIYVSSLASNELFKFSLTMMFVVIASMLFLFILYNLELYVINYQPLSTSNEEMLSNTDLEMCQDNKMGQPVNKFYNGPSGFVTLLLVSFLLLTLIAIVKIINIFMGPLRKGKKKQ